MSAIFALTLGNIRTVSTAHVLTVQENLLGQKFIVDATLFVDLVKPGKSDNVHDTVSYADVYRQVSVYSCLSASSAQTLWLPFRHIKTVMEGRPHKLLESVASRLADEILSDYHQVQGLQLHIKKPHVAVTGVLESLGESETVVVAISNAAFVRASSLSFILQVLRLHGTEHDIALGIKRHVSEVTLSLTAMLTSRRAVHDIMNASFPS